MIVFNRVCKNGLKNLSFNINRGEFVYIYDASERVLEMLRDLMSGKEKPESGVISWLNCYNFNPELLKGDIGVVFKDNILLPDRTLAENLQFIMEIKGLNRAHFNLRLIRVLNIVGLEGYQNFRPGELLGHQLVRANIAQALLNYPSILILEDPSSRLDEVNSQAIIHLLKKINRLSLTVILLSSDKRLVLGDDIRVIRLEKGRRNEKKKGFYA